LTKESFLQKQLIEQALLGILEARRQPSTVTPSNILGIGFSQAGTMIPPSIPPEPLTGAIRFIELGLCYTAPREICEELSEKLNLPPIPGNYCRQIPAALDSQGPSMKPMNKSADLNLTIAAFAEKIAKWLQQKHSALFDSLATQTT
jgi:hypothetical protein